MTAITLIYICLVFFATYHETQCQRHKNLCMATSVYGNLDSGNVIQQRNQCIPVRDEHYKVETICAWPIFECQLQVNHGLPQVSVGTVTTE